MNIIVIGAGEVGSYIAEMLCIQNHNVTLIEQNETLALQVDGEINAKVYEGDGATAETLRKAKVDDADFVLAMTTNDATNLVSCSLAKALGAETTIARIHHKTYSDCANFNYQLQFGIDYLINPEALCAIELARAVRNPGRIAVETFARGQIEVLQVRVSPNSKYKDRTLKELNLGSDVRIGYILSGKELIIPTAETLIETGDLLTLVGSPNDLYNLKSAFNPDISTEVTNITLYAGTETSIMLARLLSNSRFKIRFIEKKAQICDELSKQFPAANVIRGDATSLRLLEEEQIGRSDYFIACSTDDEDNIMTGIQAKRLGAEHVQLVVNKADYEPVLDEIRKTLGVELAVSPRSATIKELMRYISTETLIELAKLQGGNALILEAVIPTTCEFVGKTIREIPWTPNTVIIGQLHKYRAKVPNADSKILAGDRLIIITDKNQKKALHALLS